MLAAVFPWTPAFALIRRDPRLSFLAAWLAFAFLFFSVSRNKLPGYMLPLMPALCLVVAVALQRSNKWIAVIVAFLAALLPAASTVLPEALERGISHSRWQPPWGMLILPIAAAAIALAIRRMFIPAVITCLAVIFIKAVILPELDPNVSARHRWNETKPSCLSSDTSRNFQFGYSYYAGRELPICEKSTILDRE